MDSNVISTVLDILPFIQVGFLAQMVDGCLGMAYGVTSRALMILVGLPIAGLSIRTLYLTLAQ